MSPGRRVIALLLCLSAGACHGGGARALASSPPRLAWRTIATPADRTRLHDWRDAWTTALAQVAAAGKAGEIAAQGPLMQPDGALDDPRPPAGAYRCRTFRLGTKQAGGEPYVAEPEQPCRIAVEHDVLSFAVLAGPQRRMGLLFQDDEARRMILLGTMTLGDEARAFDYGIDPERDIAGALERVGPRQWRIALPHPSWGATLDVIALTPAD